MPSNNCSLLELSSISISGSSFDDNMTGRTAGKKQKEKVGWLGNSKDTIFFFFLTKRMCTSRKLMEKIAEKEESIRSKMGGIRKEKLGKELEVRTNLQNSQH